MKQTERIVVNITVSLTRMAFTVGIGLYAIRVLVDALGEVNFGLLGAVNGGLAIMNILQAALLQSCQRNLAYQIGKDDPEQLRGMFSTCFIIFVITAVLLVSVGILSTPWVLDYMQFPPERGDAMEMFWPLMVLTLGIVSVRSAFHGLFMARQALVQDAAFMLIWSLMRLAAIIATSIYDGDRLIFYGYIFVGINLIELSYMIIVALIRFPESHVKFSSIHMDHIKQLLSFGGWGIPDLLVLRLRDNGGNFILNPFFGPIVNAAFSVGVQAQVYPRRITQAVAQATQPAIIQRYAKGNYEYVKEIVLATGRMSTLFVSLLILPFLLEMDYILEIWFKKVPENAAVFCSLFFLGILVEQLVLGFVSAVQAVGKIGRFTTISTIIMGIPLLVTITAFALGYQQPELLLQLLLAGVCCTVAFQAWFVGRMIDVPLSRWLTQVVFRMLVAIGGSYLIATAVQMNYGPASFMRFVLVTLSCLSSLAILGWLFGLTRIERAKIIGWGGSAVQFIKARLK